MNAKIKKLNNDFIEQKNNEEITKIITKVKMQLIRGRTPMFIMYAHMKLDGRIKFTWEDLRGKI